MGSPMQTMPITERERVSGSIRDDSSASRHQETCEHHESPASNPLPDSISAMGARLTDTNDTDMRDQYYGQSSIISLVQECAQTPPGQLSQPFQPRSADPVTSSTSSTRSCNVSCDGGEMSSLLSDDFSLPPRKIADWLLDIYFTNSHLFYPWVHKESFLASYNLMWSNRDSCELTELPDVGIGGSNCPIPVFFCGLNAMLAIACEFSSMPSKEKRKSSMMFYERMKSLINIDILDSGSLAHIQALLLVAIYLQCTPYPRRCWNIVGMAYRMSVGLGLHLRRHSSELSGIEKEMRWRTWCACVQMDMYGPEVSSISQFSTHISYSIVSMTMGRPAMTLMSSNVPLPSPTDDEYLTVEGHQPAGTVSSNQFLYENMKLIGILGDILSKVYHSAAPGPEAESPRPPADFQAVIDIDGALDEFEASLHPVLDWDPSKALSHDMNPLFRRQANVLHARYVVLSLGKFIRN